MKKHLHIIAPALLIALLAAFAIAKPAAAAAPATDDTIVLEAFGASFGLAVYNSQVVVGLTADSLTKDLYTKEEATTIIAEQKGGLDTLQDYVKKIQASSIAANEAETLQEMIVCIDKLQATIAALDAFLADRSKDNADDFEAKRQTSYTAIAKLLGIKATE